MPQVETFRSVPVDSFRADIDKDFHAIVSTAPGGQAVVRVFATDSGLQVDELDFPSARDARLFVATCLEPFAL